MGNYNPHQPYLLGQEWVPIRDEDIAFSPAVNSVELGHGFVFPIAVGIQDARFYINELHVSSDRGQTFMAALYPIGTEDESGPISSVVIPVNAVTGTNATASGAATLVDALLTQSSASGVVLNTASADAGIAMSFAVSGALVLTGKRILGVNLLSGTAATADITGPLRDVNTSQIVVGTNTTINSAATPQALFGRLRLEREIDRTPFGEINQFWTANSPTTIADRVPWTYAQLTRLDAVATRLFAKIETGTNRGTTASSSCYIFYAALEVIYCEEKRVAVGATQFGTTNSTYSFGTDSVLGANRIVMHDMASALNPIIPAGEYAFVLSSADVGGLNDNQAQLTSDYPDLNAVRELYAIPPHPGIQVNLPFPLVDHIGDTFTSEQTHILPQLTLHASGTGTVVEPHVYGRQAIAQVYGTNTATQEIYDDISGVAASYPQVRYYARRFGDTTVPLTLTGTGVFTGSTVSITPATFDALVEILDGWREVTLRFINAPTMGAATGTPGWTWSANGETSGNRWEVLAASAPAVSGIPTNLYNLVPAPNQLGSGTYQPPSGATVELTWMPQGIASPWVTSPSSDAATDAVLMFSQDPPTVTGVTLTARTQTVTGFALDCGALPCCIPTGIAYQQVTWDGQGLTGLVEDSFTRTVANGLGSPDIGGAYTITDVATAYQVNGSEAIITPSAVNPLSAYGTIDVGSPDFDITLTTGVVGNIVTSSAARSYATGRFTDANNNYAAFIQQTQSTGLVVVGIAKYVAGVETLLLTGASQLVIDGGGRVNMRFIGQGTLLKMKVWAQSDPEPATWNIETTDGSLTTGNRAGFAGQSRTILGNVIAFDNLRITAPSYWFGGYELQRYDSIAADFQTIMLASDIAQVSFNDFEARVGVNSVYRIRALNALNFAGAWSLQVTGAPPAPGITGGCADSTGALIFTSNADQTGAHNAAYVMQWDGLPVESFGLPEADMVTYQPMYGRDGSVAFHGTERGLETFDRTVLLAAAAIDPARLADAKTIRELAWDDLPYVCVRDDIGDRWFSSVRVPAVSARFNRTNYMARIEIVETTRTPYPVDP